MKVSERYYDEIFPFKGEWDMPSSCGLKIREAAGKTYVIVTELYQDNPGSSVTYAGRYLAEQVCQYKGLDLNKIVYVECAPDTNSKLSFYDEEFYIADFSKDKRHRYRQMTPDEIRVMLKSEIEAEEKAAAQNQ